MAKRQSEIEIPFTPSPSGKTAWAIVDHAIELQGVKVDEYYFIINLEKPSLIITKRDRGRERP